MRDRYAGQDAGMTLVMLTLFILMVYSHDRLFVFKCAAFLVALNLADISAEIARLRRAYKEMEEKS